MRLSLLLALPPALFLAAAQDIPRRLPPPGLELPADQRAEIEAALAELGEPADPDHAIFPDALRLALRFGEFYTPGDIGKARALAAAARARRADTDHAWRDAAGLQVRGYRSSIDDSVQPYGLELPAGLADADGPVPLYVWLHGRADKGTNLHFIHERMTRPGKLQVPGAIVAHPFGRQCVGYKHAGEIDVLDVAAEVQRLFPVDPDRVVLMGFSMGGAGVWHIGAHFPDRWAAMSPGAGFAETAEYNRLAPADYPPDHEQTLWRVYDVPNYVRNLFNLPVVAYSGELDKQIQAARVMERVFAAEGRRLAHLVGPGMGHKYHPDTLADILHRMAAAKRNPPHDGGHLQTPTLQYNRAGGLEALALGQHWRDARIDWEDGRVATTNVTSFRFADGVSRAVTIDGQRVEAAAFHLDGDTWRPGAKFHGKRPGLQGPIDDAFRSRFVVGGPTGRDATSDWIDAELRHFEERWAALFRGALRQRPADRIDPAAPQHLVLFGTPATNPRIREILPELPLVWTADTLEIGGKRYDARTHLPVLIRPNPLNPERYVVLNSGPTFREGHDRTNSLQNPKLPDWAVLRIDRPRTAHAAAEVVAAGFHGENW